MQTQENIANQPTLELAQRTHRLLAIDGLRDQAVQNRLQSELFNTDLLDRSASSGKWYSGQATADRVGAIAHQGMDYVNGSQETLNRTEGRLAYSKALDYLLVSLVSGNNEKLQLDAKQFAKYRNNVLNSRTESEQIKALEEMFGALPSDTSRRLYSNIERLELPGVAASPNMPIDTARNDFAQYHTQTYNPTPIQQVSNGENLDKVALNEAIRFRTLGQYGEAKELLFGVLGNEARQAFSTISEDDKKALRDRTTEELKRTGAMESLGQDLEARKDAMVRVLRDRATRSGHPLPEKQARKIVDEQVQVQLKNASESRYNDALEQEVIRRMPQTLSGVKGDALRELRKNYLDGQSLNFSARERDAFYETALSVSSVLIPGAIAFKAGKLVSASVLGATGSTMRAGAAALATEGAAFTVATNILNTPSEGSTAWTGMPQHILENIGMFGVVKAGHLLWNSTGRNLLTKAYGIKNANLLDGMTSSQIAGDAQLLNAMGRFSTEVSAFTTYGLGVQELSNLVDGRPLGKDVLKRLEQQGNESLKTLIGLKIGGKVIGPMLEASLAKMGTSAKGLRRRLGQLFQKQTTNDSTPADPNSNSIYAVNPKDYQYTGTPPAYSIEITNPFFKQTQDGHRQTEPLPIQQLQIPQVISSPALDSPPRTQQPNSGVGRPTEEEINRMRAQHWQQEPGSPYQQLKQQRNRQPATQQSPSSDIMRADLERRSSAAQTAHKTMYQNLVDSLGAIEASSNIPNAFNEWANKAVTGSSVPQNFINEYNKGTKNVPYIGEFLSDLRNGIRDASDRETQIKLLKEAKQTIQDAFWFGKEANPVLEQRLDTNKGPQKIAVARSRDIAQISEAISEAVNQEDPIKRGSPQTKGDLAKLQLSYVADGLSRDTQSGRSQSAPYTLERLNEILSQDTLSYHLRNAADSVKDKSPTGLALRAIKDAMNGKTPEEQTSILTETAEAIRRIPGDLQTNQGVTAKAPTPEATRPPASLPTNTAPSIQREQLATQLSPSSEIMRTDLESRSSAAQTAHKTMYQNLVDSLGAIEASSNIPNAFNEWANKAVTGSSVPQNFINAHDNGVRNVPYIGEFLADLRNGIRDASDRETQIKLLEEAKQTIQGAFGFGKEANPVLEQRLDTQAVPHTTTSESAVTNRTSSAPSEQQQPTEQVKQNLHELKIPPRIATLTYDEAENTVRSIANKNDNLATDLLVDTQHREFYRQFNVRASGISEAENPLNAYETWLKQTGVTDKNFTDVMGEAGILGAMRGKDAQTQRHIIDATKEIIIETFDTYRKDIEVEEAKGKTSSNLTANQGKPTQAVITPDQAPDSSSAKAHTAGQAGIPFRSMTRVPNPRSMTRVLNSKEREDLANEMSNNQRSRDAKMTAQRITLPEGVITDLAQRNTYLLSSLSQIETVDSAWMRTYLKRMNDSTIEKLIKSYKGAQQDASSQIGGLYLEAPTALSMQKSGHTIISMGVEPQDWAYGGVGSATNRLRVLLKKPEILAGRFGHKKLTDADFNELDILAINPKGELVIAEVKSTADTFRIKNDPTHPKFDHKKSSNMTDQQFYKQLKFASQIPNAEMAIYIVDTMSDLDRSSLKDYFERFKKATNLSLNQVRVYDPSGELLGIVPRSK